MTQRLSFTPEGVQFAWDATSISAWEKCEVYYDYTILQGWRKVEESVDLRFGSHYATALEHFHKHRAQGVDYDEAVYLVVKEALEATWDRQYEADDEDNPVEVSSGPWTPLHDTKTRPNLIRSIIWYLDHFKNDEAKVITLEDGRPAVELSFSFEVDHGIMLSGHLDRLVAFAGDIYVMDQKTTGGTITKKYFDYFNPNTQMSLYSFAGRAVFAVAVKGVIIDAAQIAVGSTRFERGFTFRTHAQLDEWYDEALDKIKEAQDKTAKGKFRHNPQSCSQYGGCPFLHVCSRSPEVRPQFLRADFHQTEGWDPLKRR